VKKVAIIYGAYQNGIQKKAIEILTESLLDYTLEYPVCFSADEITDLSEYRRIYIGTKENNAYIAQNSANDLSHPEEYSIRVHGDIAVIEGSDDSGVLYGCVDFFDRFIVHCEHPNTDRYWSNPFEQDWPDFELSSRPSIRQRGIWTWGHVIYNFKGFIDHMVRLKMNTLIIWNDHPPINAKDMIAYAHACGVKLIWGFAWFWDTNCGKIDIEQAMASSDKILAQYQQEYHPLGGDGIYFQSFTELPTEKIGDHFIAEAVTAFVNKTAAGFLNQYPDMELQFGLHATSVKDKLDYIRRVDPRVRIVWENCGSFPFSYIPDDLGQFDETCDFVRKIAVLRGAADRFGVVTKGLTKLNWQEFEHIQGPVHPGVSSNWMKENRLIRKRRIWRFLQAGWIIPADKVWKMIRLLQQCKDGDLVATALVEDGMFGECIMYPVALYAEMLWDQQSDVKGIMQRVALRSNVTFA